MLANPFEKYGMGFKCIGSAAAARSRCVHLGFSVRSLTPSSTGRHAGKSKSTASIPHLCEAELTMGRRIANPQQVLSVVAVGRAQLDDGPQGWAQSYVLPYIIFCVDVRDVEDPRDAELVETCPLSRYEPSMKAS